MSDSSKNAEIILRLIEDSLKARDKNSAVARLNNLWGLLLCSRAQELTSGLRQITDTKVHDGPFKGMLLTEAAVRLFRAPILLGCYEHELHPALEKVISADYDCIVNIGCSAGYYAVGLACRMPRAVIDAFDIDPDARRKCAEMARLNGVEDRVRLSGQFYGDTFSDYADRRTLVLVDIEGAEKELLNPVRYPALQKMDVIVELHDLVDPEISHAVCARFEASHAIEIIKNTTILPNVSGLLPEDFYLAALDHFLLGWESRDGPTPWGVFLKKEI